jgi:RNA polymerase sigma-70 factor (ECF subfamily)
MNRGTRRTVWNDVTGLAVIGEVRMTRGATERSDDPEREAAFQALVGPRLDRAFGLAWHLLGHASDAEDACQEALVAAWTAWPRLRDPARFDAWFDRILVNTCIEHLRRRARRPVSELPDEPGIAARDLLAGSIAGDVIGRALRNLSPEHRVTVVLRYWADLSTEAIADRLGVPPGTVRSRLHYALDALRVDLVDDEPDR